LQCEENAAAKIASLVKICLENIPFAEDACILAVHGMGKATGYEADQSEIALQNYVLIPSPRRGTVLAIPLTQTAVGPLRQRIYVCVRERIPHAH
jgi:hypothetical protein